MADERDDKSDLAKKRDHDALALKAIATPGTDAVDALDVLVDALLEAGVLDHDGAYVWTDAPPEWREPAFGLRRRAFQWAKQRLAPMPSPLEQIGRMVQTVLEQEGVVQHAVVGVVSPSILRVHFPRAIEAVDLESARLAVALRLPPSLTIEASSGGR